jgi:hypothetical protein
MSLTSGLFGLTSSSGLSGLSEGLAGLAGRVSDTQAKYPDASRIIAQLVEADPAGNQKYLAWMAHQAVTLEEPVDEVIDLVRNFHHERQRIRQRDLYHYKTLGELRGVIEALPEKTKKEVVAALKERWDPNDYTGPKKVVVTYSDAFDLLCSCLGEGGMYEGDHCE